jgi:hypothetical protein
VTALSVERLVLDPDEYAAIRPERRKVAIGLRRQRRVHVGDLVTVEFENAETLAYQAQEMLYVEKVTDPAAATAEIAVYARLLPGPATLTATLMIEIDDQAQVRQELERLRGLHESVRLEIGSHICAAYDVPPPDEGPSGRTVSVHFLRFDLTDEAVAALHTDVSVRLVVEHPAYAAAVELSAEARGALVADLAGCR